MYSVFFPDHGGGSSTSCSLVLVFFRYGVSTVQVLSQAVQSTKYSVLCSGRITWTWICSFCETLGETLGEMLCENIFLPLLSLLCVSVR